MTKLSYVILALVIIMTGCGFIDPDRFTRLPLQTDIPEMERQEKIDLLTWGESHFHDFLHQLLTEEEDKKFREFLRLMVNVMGYKQFPVEKVAVFSMQEREENKNSNGCFFADTGYLKLNPNYFLSIKTLIHEFGHAFYEGLLYADLSLGSEQLKLLYFNVTSKQAFDPAGWQKHFELVAERNVLRYLQGRARLTKQRALKALELYPAKGGYPLCRLVGDHVYNKTDINSDVALEFILSATDHQTLWDVIKTFNPGDHGSAIAEITMANFEEVILTSYYEDQDDLNEKILAWAPSQIRKAVNLALKERSLEDHFKRFAEKKEEFFSQFADE